MPTTSPTLPTGRPRRIALVCDWFLPRVGGIELHLRDLALRLKGEGHHVEILTPTPGPPLVDGIPVRRLRILRAPVFGFAISPKLVSTLRRELREMDADLVHTHISIVAPTGWSGARAAVSLALPCIATFHSLPTGPIPPALDLLNLLWGWRSWPVHWTAVSGLVALHLSPLIDGRSVEMLPNAVDPAEWEGDGRRDGAALHIVSVMRLYRRKRPHALVEMAARLRQELPDVPFIWTVAGDGPERARTEAAARRRGVWDRFHFTGFVSRERVRELLASGDLFVLPAVLESFGIAALQARAAGLPVLARREGGVGGFIRDGVDGLLRGSDQEMGAALLHLVRNPAELQRLRAGGRTSRHGWDRVLPLYGAAREAADRIAGSSPPEMEGEERRPPNALKARSDHPPPTTGTR